MFALSYFPFLCFFGARICSVALHLCGLHGSASVRCFFVRPPLPRPFFFFSSDGTPGKGVHGVRAGSPERDVGGTWGQLRPSPRIEQSLADALAGDSIIRWFVFGDDAT